MAKTKRPDSGDEQSSARRNSRTTASGPARPAAADKSADDLAAKMSGAEELSARFAFTSPIDGIQWSANELRAGLMILLLPEPLQSTPLDPKERERQ